MNFDKWQAEDIEGLFEMCDRDKLWVAGAEPPPGDRWKVYRGVAGTRGVAVFRVCHGQARKGRVAFSFSARVRFVRRRHEHTTRLREYLAKKQSKALCEASEKEIPMDGFEYGKTLCASIASLATLRDLQCGAQICRIDRDWYLRAVHGIVIPEDQQKAFFKAFRRAVVARISELTDALLAAESRRRSEQELQKREARRRELAARPRRPCTICGKITPCINDDGVSICSQCQRAPCVRCHKRTGILHPVLGVPCCLACRKRHCFDYGLIGRVAAMRKYQLTEIEIAHLRCGKAYNRRHGWYDCLLLRHVLELVKQRHPKRQ